MTYCLVPRDLAPKLHELLRDHFADNPSIEVVVERRAAERRQADDRRRLDVQVAADSRLIRNQAGRRIESRRAPAVEVDPPPLPVRARAYARDLAFVERIEPSAEHLADIDSARLVTRFQSGDTQAFTALYIRYFDRVYAYARVLFRGNEHEAEDITQQVFVKAFEALPRYTQRGRPFRSWLFTIVRNRALMELKTRGRSEPAEPEVIDEQRGHELPHNPPASLDWLTDRELVMFVDRLPLSQRQVLVLKYGLDLPAKEIAQVLGRSYVDVRQLEYRALRYLEARLTAIGRRTPQEGQRRLPTHTLVRWMPVFRQRRAALQRNPGRVRML